MEDSIGEGLRRGATGDHVADLGDHRLVRTSLEGHAWTHVEPAPAPLDVRRVDHALGVVLTLGGELDLASVPQLRQQLNLAMRGGGAVVIDLSGLRFIDSSGLHLLLETEQQLRASSAKLVLVHGSGAVRRVFELTSLDRYFVWSDSPSAALRTALEPHVGSRAIPKPAANPQTEAEVDRELGGEMRS